MEHSQISTPIQVTCEVSETLALAEMLEFQGELKTRTPSDYDIIFASIRKNGIAFPFFVWQSDGKNFVLDGHGRVGALRRGAATGYIIPSLPVVYIQAADEKTAKNLLLRLNSRYGTITLDGIREFLDGADIDLTTVNIPELPDLSERLDALLGEMGDSQPDFDPPEFLVYCPECGEVYETNDEELKEAIGYED